MNNRAKLLIAILAIIVLAIFLRALPIVLYGTFFDENTMTAVLVIKQAIPYLHPVPDYLSGHPIQYAEQGIIWLAVIIYYVIGKYISANVLLTLYGTKALFTAIAGIAVYLFAEKIAGRGAGLFALMMYAVSQVAIYNEALNLWKGESFSAVALFLALFFFVCFVDDLKAKRAGAPRLAALAVLCLASFLFSIFVWNGGVYAIFAFCFVILSICIWSVLKDKKIALAVIAACALLPTLVVVFSPILTYVQAFLPTPAPSGFAQNLFSMISQTQLNLIQSQSLWAATSFYYVQLLIGIVLYLCFALYAISVFRLNETYSATALAFIVLYAVFLLGVPFALAQQDWNVLIYLPFSVFAGLGLKHVWENKDTRVKIGCSLAVAVYVILGIAQLTPNTYTEVLPAINNPYLYVVSWMANNTAPNSIFITYPSYGTPIEYYANRTSLFDTNTAYNWSIQQEFLYFLAQPEGSFNYLGYLHPRPSYLVINTTWAISSPNYTIANSNLELFESAPYSITAENVSLRLAYNKYGFVIYGIYYNVISNFSPQTLVICRTSSCTRP